MSRRAALLPVLLAAVSAWAADPLSEAYQHYERREYLEAIKLALQVAQSPKDGAERRYTAFCRAAESYQAIGCDGLAIAAYEQTLVALGRDHPHAADAWTRIARIRMARGEWDEADALLSRALAQLDPEKLPQEARVALLGLQAECRRRRGRPREALALYDTLASLAKAPAERASALASAASLHIALQDFDRARACLDRLGDGLESAQVRYEASRVYQELIDRLAATGQRDPARELAAKALALLAPHDPSAAREILRRLLAATEDEAAAMDIVAGLGRDTAAAIASESVLDELVPIAIRTRRTADLVRACTHALLARPLDESVARASLAGMVDLYVGEERYDDALAAAWACYAVTGWETASTTYFTAAVDLVAHALRARDGHLVSGNAFRRYQLYGPAGPDRKEETADDIPNPIGQVKRTPEPELDRLFEAALAAQPPTLEGHRARAWIYMLWAKPQKAMGELKRVFALAPMESTALTRAAQDVANGLRALRATPVGMEAFARFQRYGPNGQDGRAGTPDDLEDPLADY